jgi:hypothetical protein
MEWGKKGGGGNQWWVLSSLRGTLYIQMSGRQTALAQMCALPL